MNCYNDILGSFPSRTPEHSKAKGKKRQKLTPVSEKQLDFSIFRKKSRPSKEKGSEALNLCDHPINLRRKRTGKKKGPDFAVHSPAILYETSLTLCNEFSDADSITQPHHQTHLQNRSLGFIFQLGTMLAGCS